MARIESSPEFVRSVYAKMEANLKVVRQLVIHQLRRNCLVVYLNFDCNLDLNLRTEGISS